MLTRIWRDPDEPSVPDNGDVTPSPDEVRHQLRRILASGEFASSERLSRFLRYVVERACDGQADQLKEFVIGTDVFDRDERYDPRLDSVVRVEASRLRTKLTEYYVKGGADDPVVIKVPKGGYVPVFEWRVAAPRIDVPHAERASERPSESVDSLDQARSAPDPPLAPTASSSAGRRVRQFSLLGAGLAAIVVALTIFAWTRANNSTSRRSTQDISVAVFPMSTYSIDESEQLLAARVTEGVTRELARLGTLQVVSHTSALHTTADRRPLPEIAQSMRADVVVSASVTHARDAIRVEAALVDAAPDRKFWVGEFDGAVTELPELERRVAEAVATAVARNSRGSYWTRHTR